MKKLGHSKGVQFLASAMRSFALCGILGLGMSQLHATGLKPYVEADAAISFIEDKWEVAITSANPEESGSSAFHSHHHPGMLRFAVGTEFSSFSENANGFMECEVDIFDHYHTIINGGCLSKTRIVPLMFNLGGAQQCGKYFRPYFLGGLGVAFVRDELGWTGNDFGLWNDHRFAWQVGLGVDCEITKHLSLDLGYTFADFGKESFSAPFEGNPDTIGSFSHRIFAHKLHLGLNYQF